MSKHNGANLMRSILRVASQRLPLRSLAASSLLCLAFGAGPLSAQTIDGGELELRCERQSRYPTISFSTEMETACADLSIKANQYLQRAKVALPPPQTSSWLPSWVQSPQCKESEYRAFEESTSELRRSIGRALAGADDILTRANNLMKMAKEMNSSHNAARAVEIGRQSEVFTDMAEDTVRLVPKIQIEYADRALAAKCYLQADKAYRVIIEHYPGETALRDRAKIGIEDVRARQR